jgi:hypothetical protein
MGGTCCKHRSSDQVGRALLPIPWFIVNAVLDSCEQAEKFLGHPPNSVQIYTWMEKHHPRIPCSGVYILAAFMTSIFREDLIFTNQIMTGWSIRRYNESYKTFSEIFQAKFAGFALDRN